MAPKFLAAMGAGSLFHLAAGDGGSLDMGRMVLLVPEYVHADI